jgi:hypothetical protein
VSARYGWIVTEDHDGDRARSEGFEQASDVGTLGPRDVSPGFARQLKENKGKSWRAYDDDGTLLYTGRYIGPLGGDEMFGPLEDFAMPNAGATTIKYKNGRGAWETL